MGGYTADNLTSVLVFTSLSCLWSSERNLPKTTKAKIFPLDLTFLVSWLLLLPSFQCLYLRISTILSLSFFLSISPRLQATILIFHLSIPFSFPICLFSKSQACPHTLARNLGFFEFHSSFSPISCVLTWTSPSLDKIISNKNNKKQWFSEYRTKF